MLVAGTFAAIASAAAAAEVAIDVHRAEGIVVIDASVEIKADPVTAWRVLTDYARYPEFVPGMETNRGRYPQQFTDRQGCRPSANGS